MSYLQGLPAFASYFAMGLGFIALFLVLYLQLTPHRELSLIRSGNQAASIALGGALLGFALPLASALAHTVSMLDLAIWASIALVCQAAAYGFTRLLLPDFTKRIEAGEQSAAWLATGLHLAVGLINAAAMGY